jgi:hypothetical protein
MSLARYDAFDHLCDGLCLEAADVVATLSAYFDESGTDVSKPAVAVACYVATVAQWKCFKADWRRLRRRSGVTGYFHRSEQESFWLHDDTKHWDRERQITVYQAQHAFIHAYTLKGFAGVVIKDEYDAAVTGAIRQALGSAYEFCLRHCLAAIANWLDAERPNDNISYFIESGGDGEGHLRRAFNLFLDNPELKKAHRLENIYSWAFIGKRNAMPLQAADALAFESAKEMENIYGTVKRQPRLSFLDLFRPEIDDIRWVPKQLLVEYCDAVWADREIRKAALSEPWLSPKDKSSAKKTD